MNETKMPAAEAAVTPLHDDEHGAYEIAFHVLPTVAEGEVSGVFDQIKAFITKGEGEIFDEEMPERFDLAYEIVEHIEGKNRRFTSAYFGWIRFTAEPGKVAAITEEIDAHADILRQMMVRLTRAEETYPFRFHEALASEKQVTTIEEEKAVVEPAAETETKVTKEAEVEVDDKKTDEAAEKSDA